MNTNKNLWQRIAAVMQDVEYLKKDDSVGSGSYAYKAISEEKVTETIRVSLIKNGLVIFPIEQLHSQKDHVREGGKIVPISTLDVKYKIVNIDNPQEFEVLVGSGTGVDPQDKGVGKAATYAYKYMLIRTFAIPTGEDPDKIHNNDLNRIQEAATAKAAERNTTPEQTAKIKELVTNPAINAEIKGKVLASLPTLNFRTAAGTIAKLQETINAAA